MYTRTNSERKETRTKMNSLEQKEEINIRLQQKEETRIQKNEERLGNLWDNFKHSNIGTPEEEEEEQEIENLFEKIMKGELPQSGKGNRLPGCAGSSESQRSWTQGSTYQGTS